MIELSSDCAERASDDSAELRRNGRPTDGELLQNFIRFQDESAFEMLVRRHGPMVHGVCRRILRDSHAADDAFQATFLVLARKCHSLRTPEAVANWLFGVAYRVARKARENAARRREHERRAAEEARHKPGDAVMRNELIAILDEEINRLPAKYRAPLVLCYLEGVTNAEAARLLGWPEGSISSRLAKARNLLRTRLTRRGVTFSASLLAAILLRDRSSAAALDVFIGATVEGVVLNARGVEGGAALAPSVVDLADEVLRGMELGRAQAAIFALALLLLVGFAVVPSGVELWGATLAHSPVESAEACSSALPTDDPANGVESEHEAPASETACGVGACTVDPE